MVVKINGDICSNSMKPVYDWFGYEAFSPGDLAYFCMCEQCGGKSNHKKSNTSTKTPL